MQKCRNIKGQKWIYDHNQGTLKSQHTNDPGLCIQYSTTQLDDNKPLKVFHCTNKKSQKFEWKNSVIMARHPRHNGKRMVIDVKGGGGQGTRLILWEQNGGNNQKFKKN